MKRRLERGVYAALGIVEGANPQIARGAFLQLTKVYHPAKFAREAPEIVRQANEVFLALRAAYETISPVARKANAGSASGFARRTGEEGALRDPTPATVSRPPSQVLGPARDVTPAPTTRVPSMGQIPGPGREGATARPPPAGVVKRPGEDTPRAPTPPTTAATATPAAKSGSGTQSGFGTAGASKPAAAQTQTQNGFAATAASKSTTAQTQSGFAKKPVVSTAAPTAAPAAAPTAAPAKPPAAAPAKPPAAASMAQLEADAPGTTAEEDELESAMTLLRRKQWTEARKILHALAARVPAEKRYRSLLSYARGREAQDIGRHDEARTEFNRALTLDPDLQIAKSALAQVTVPEPPADRPSGGLFSKLFKK